MIKMKNAINNKMIVHRFLRNFLVFIFIAALLIEDPKELLAKEKTG